MLLFIIKRNDDENFEIWTIVFVADSTGGPDAWKRAEVKDVLLLKSTDARRLEINVREEKIVDYDDLAGLLRNVLV